MRERLKKHASVVLVLVLFSISVTAAPKDLNPQLAAYVKARAGEFGQIGGERTQRLDKLAVYVHSQIAQKHSAKLLFICTHNSRRSHSAQIWAQTAALYYGVAPVETFSGGTEATAFNLHAVAALRRVGFEIAPVSAGSNPRYRVQYSSSATPMTAFSKTYNSPVNPHVDFAVVMTCANADRLCPVVRGASLRVATLYDDPKSADGTPQESQTYDECVQRISRELLYLFSRVSNNRDVLRTAKQSIKLEDRRPGIATFFVMKADSGVTGAEH